MVRKNNYLSSLDPGNEEQLLYLTERMFEYYTKSPYHSQYIQGINNNWQVGSHDVQLAMCKIIPENSQVLEVGCGDGSAGREISDRLKTINYTGVDLSSEMWQNRQDLHLIPASADKLPFNNNSFDVVLSMFVIEHLVFPSRFLDEAWKVLKPGGMLITIAPDFDINAMASERIGFSYGTGRTKLAEGKIWDAIMTTYDTRIRLHFQRMKRRNTLKKGVFEFPILTEPRCLHFEGFVVDCDAVYPVTKQEIINYIQTKDDFESSEVFYQNQSTFGLIVRKK